MARRTRRRTRRNGGRLSRRRARFQDGGIILPDNGVTPIHPNEPIVPQPKVKLEDGVGRTIKVNNSFEDYPEQYYYSVPIDHREKCPKGMHLNKQKGVCIQSNNSILSPGIGGDTSLPGGISPAPVDGITYNYPAGSFLISFPFRAYPQEDFGSHVSNSDPSDGVGFPLEEGVWSVEEFESMLAPGGQIKKITGVHPTQNQGVATQKVNGVWVGSLTHIYPQMAYWVEFSSPINQRVNAPYGMISRDYKMVTHAGPNYRAYPFPDKPEYRDIEPSDTSVVSNTIADGTITRELIGVGSAANYNNITVTDPVTQEITFQGWTWVGSFRFNPGQGFILQTSEGMNYYWQQGCGNNWQHMDLNCPSLFGVM
tara:strand:+ start:6375 stop:7478 length:1104 start_codon:yes stop_codon:yes gene_type:complete